MAGVSNRAGMLGLTFEVIGVPQVARVLGVQAKAVRNLTPVWDDLAADFRQREKTVFGNEGAVQGWSKWQELAEGYASWKQAHGYSSAILVRTGDLKSSLTTSGKGHVFVKAPLRMEIGTSIPYAKYHQSPQPRQRSKSGKVRLPRREPIRVTAALRRHWVRLIQAFIVQSGQFERESIGGLTRKSDWRSRADAGFAEWAED